MVDAVGGHDNHCQMMLIAFSVVLVESLHVVQGFCASYDGEECCGDGGYYFNDDGQCVFFLFCHISFAIRGLRFRCRHCLRSRLRLVFLR